MAAASADPPQVIRHTVPAETAPERLDKYLVRILPDLSRSRVQKLILEGHVRRGTHRLRPSAAVWPGEQYVIELQPAASTELKGDAIPLEIIHEDDFLLVVNKPAGMVSHPAPGHSRGTLVNALVSHGSKLSKVGGPQKLGIVHRLDQDTSGIILVAKDDKTHLNLSRQFAGREVKRVYVALVRGVVQRDEGTIDAPIGRHPFQRELMSIRPDSGRDAVTRYKVKERFANATLLELYPQTGRTHQLRVHLKHIGHPILGDARYGIRGGFARQALHAHRLGFFHPGIEQWVEFVSPLPVDLQHLLHLLKKKY